MRLRRDLLDGAKALLRPGLPIGDRLFGLLGAIWALALLLAIPVAAALVALSLVRGHIIAAAVWVAMTLAAWVMVRATLLK